MADHVYRDAQDVPEADQPPLQVWRVLPVDATWWRELEMAQVREMRYLLDLLRSDLHQGMCGPMRGEEGGKGPVIFEF